MESMCQASVQTLPRRFGCVAKEQEVPQFLQRLFTELHMFLHSAVARAVLTRFFYMYLRSRSYTS